MMLCVWNEPTHPLSFSQFPGNKTRRSLQANRSSASMRVPRLPFETNAATQQGLKRHCESEARGNHASPRIRVLGNSLVPSLRATAGSAAIFPHHFHNPAPSRSPKGTFEKVLVAVIASDRRERGNLSTRTDCFGFASQ
jgi:hypothetical protein